jgi:putative DNA primase/helicase
VLAGVVGADSVCSPTLASIATNFGLSALIGKTVAIIGDARLSGKTDIAATAERLLSISGEDAQTIDRKHKDPITTTLQARFMVLTNELPQIRDASGALASRMLVLKLTKSFAGKEDTGLYRRLLTERQALLRWAIEGWRKLQEQGRFTQPHSAQDDVEHLRSMSSPVSEFVAERCVLKPSLTTDVAELYDDFRKWAESVGIRNIPERNVFSRNITAAFPELERHREKRGGLKHTVIKGVCLVPQF